MPAIEPVPSPRWTELLEASYSYVLQHGLSDLSLRPLAAAVGSSPRVLLYLFGSKDGLIRELLARARIEELAFLDGTPTDGLSTTGKRLWTWLAAPAHRPLMVLWVEAYARSLVEADGPWSGFARQTVEDWLDLLARAQPESERVTSAGRAQRTALLATLRGGLLDLLATGETERVSQAVEVAIIR